MGKKYPVIFDPYGGPNNQRTTKTFRQVDFRAYLASDPELEYILLVVDNRGTGFKGRAFREVVAGQLGTLEAIDQVYAAKDTAREATSTHPRLPFSGGHTVVTSLAKSSNS